LHDSSCMSPNPSQPRPNSDPDLAHCIAPAGQALVDSVTAAAYNVIFTSVPILIFAVVDRPVQHFETLIRYPQASSRFPC